MTNQPHREWIYRQAFHMGRHVIGYEVQKVLSAVEWLKKSSPEGRSIPGALPPLWLVHSNCPCTRNRVGAPRGG